MLKNKICWKNDDDDDVFVGIQKNRFSTKLPQMLTTSSVCAAAFADNAFAGTDAEELKNFLIGFWNFRTGDVTSILLYTVAPIALPYLIFSKVREREETSIFISRRPVLSFVTVLFLHLSFSLTRSIERRLHAPHVSFSLAISLSQLGEQKMEKQMATLEEGGWIEYMTERGLDVKELTLVQVNVFVKAAEKGALDDELVGEFVKQQQLNEKWKQSTINVEDTRAAAAARRARAQAIIEAREEREKQESS